MPQKLNKAGQMQDYIPKGNGDASGEYGTSNGTNKNFTTSDKKKTEANVITENVDVVWLKDKINETAKKKTELDDKNSTRNVYGTEEERDREGAKKLGVSLEEYKKMKEQHKEKMALKDRIENLEGVIKNIENGDPTGAEDLQDMKRRLKNAKEQYERYYGKDSDRLRKILGERNRNEDIDHAIDTDYFGFGSLDKLEEAHKNNYGKVKANIIDNDLSGKGKQKDINDFSKVFDNDDLTITFENDKYSYAKSGIDGMKKNQFLETLGATVSNKKQREHLATRNDGKWTFNVKNNKTGETKAITLNNDELFSLWNKVKNKGDLEKKGNNYFSVSFQKERQEKNKKDFED